MVVIRQDKKHLEIQVAGEAEQGVMRGKNTTVKEEEKGEREQKHLSMTEKRHDWEDQGLGKKNRKVTKKNWKEKSDRQGTQDEDV